MALGLGSSLVKGGASLLTFVKDNLKLYLDFKSNKSDTLKFPSEGSTSFNGSNTSIQAGQSNNLGTGTNFTISCWFKNLGTARAYILQLQKSSGSTNLTLQVNSNSSVSTAGYISMMLWDGANHQFVNYDGSIDDNKWHHVAVTTTSSAQVVYFDGKSVATGSKTFSNSFSEHPINIGSVYNTSGFNYNGDLANLAIWSRVLTPEEVQSIMNKSYSQLKGVETTSLVSWWALDSASDGLVQPATGEELGNEISGDPTFDNASNWLIILGSGSLDVNTTVLGKLSAVDAQDKRLYKYSILTVGKLYKVTFVIDSYSSGRVRGLLDNAITFTPTEAGTYTRYFVASNTFFLVSFDGTANMTMTDISIKEVTSNTGVVTGATTTTSVYGGNAPILPRAVDVAKEGQADAIGDGSALFNGSSDFVQVEDSNVLDAPASWTLSAWIKIGSGTSGYDRIIGKQTTGGQCNYGIGLRNGNEFGTFINDGGGFDDSNYHTTDLTVGEWYHVTGTWNGTYLKSYINGILVETSSDLSSANASVTNTAPLLIGLNATNGDQYFKGNISQAGIWQGALTQAQIQSVMESTSYSKIPADVKSTLGAERVLNSDFSDGENLWTLNNANVVNEVLEIDEGAFSYYAQQSVDGGGSNYRQFESGYLMKLEIVVDEYTSGNTIIYATGNNIGTFNSAGTHTIYYKPSANEYLRLRSGGSGFEGKISSVSIKRVTNDIVAYYPLDGSSSANGVTNDVTTGEVLGAELLGDGQFSEDVSQGSQNDNWYLITSGVANHEISNGRYRYTDSGTSTLRAKKNNSNVTLEVNKLHKLTFEIFDNNAYIQFTTNSEVLIANATYPIGTNTVYFTPTASHSSFNIKASSVSPSYSMDNASLKEVTSNTGVLK